MKIKEIISVLEQFAPLQLQENYDNCGLIAGNSETILTKALICLDCTEKVIEEAVGKNCNLIISHHPVIFGSIKSVSSQSKTGRIISGAIKNDISLYAIHTNIDNHPEGLNKILALKLGLNKPSILKPMKGILKKLVTFCPTEYAAKVRDALFAAGAGNIGNYDCCSYNISGEGTFKAQENTNPFVGNKSELHFEKETRIETVFPSYKQSSVLSALLQNHPYEEVAYDVYPLDNDFYMAGSGLMGETAQETDLEEFLKKIKDITAAKVVKYAGTKKKIRKVAICTGSGDFMIKDAINAQADIIITSEIKYHSFIDYTDKITIVDAGHYETEQFIKELLYDFLNKKFPNFAFLISEMDVNPINYF